MYNLLNGQNEGADVLLASLMLTRDDFYRFRDCYADGDTICVYTRAGGSNAECWEGEPYNACANGHVSDCVESKHDKLRNHPLYIKDMDDDFDCTYKTFVFKSPNPALSAEMSDGQTRGANSWPEIFEALEKSNISKKDLG